MSANEATRKLLDELDAHEDGRFELLEVEKKAVLKLFNQKGNGRPIHPTDVMNRVKTLQIKIDPKVALDRLVRETKEGRIKEGINHIVGDWAVIVEKKNATIEVQVSDDHMSASIFVEPPEGGGKSLTKENIIKILGDHGVKKGIIEETLDAFIKHPVYKKLMMIAKGQSPTRGENGYIKPLFDSFSKPKLSEKNKEKKVDYKDINLIRSIKAGDIIAEKIPPTQGEPGFAISGFVQPAESGDEAEFKIGTNVELSPDGKTAIAKIEGRPTLDSRGYLRVDEVVYLKNIDYSTGNIDFPGSIIVEDTVADGFKLKASGSIILQKSVGVAELTSGKDVILSAGFMGRSEGKIIAEGDIYARFVEQGMIEAKGSIYLTEASLHSKLIAGGSVIVKGGRGEIIGGEIIAGKSIQCLKLGGVGESKTVITVGVNPEMMALVRDIQTSIKDKEATIEKIRISLHRMNEAMTKHKLDEKETEMREKLILASKKYRAMLDSELKQLDSAEQSMAANEHAFVIVENQIYPNCEINFGRGLVYKSPMRTPPGRQVLYVGEDRTITISATLPRFLQNSL